VPRFRRNQAGRMPQCTPFFHSARPARPRFGEDGAP
jgi:hypothetical protein